MDFLRVEQPSFVVLPGEAAQKLSLEALGLLAWACAQGQRQLFGLPAVARQLNLSEERLSRLLQELAQHGYARLGAVRRPNGQLGGRRWFLLPFGEGAAPSPEKAPGEAASAETREPPVSAGLPTGKEEAGQAKAPHPQGECPDPPQETPFGGSPTESSPNPCALAEKPKGPFKQAGEGRGAGQIGDAENNDVGALQDAPARPQKRSVGKKKNNLDNQLPVTEEMLASPGVPEEAVGLSPDPEDLGEPPEALRKAPRYRTKPVTEWNASDFVAYMLDTARAQGKTVLVPNAALGQHMRWLLERARRLWGAHGALALKDLVDLHWTQPTVRGTGYLLREAEWFFSRWRPPAADEPW